MTKAHDLAAVGRLIGSDVDAALHYAAGFLDGKAGFARRLSFLLMPGQLCCALHRIAHWAWCKGWRRVAGLVSRINYVLHKADISPGAAIGPGMYLPHTVGVVFQAHAGSGLTLYTNCFVAPRRATAHFGAVPADAPVLGNNVTVGAYAVVAGSLSIGDDARVGPAAALSADLPANTAAFSRLRPRPVDARVPR